MQGPDQCVRDSRALKILIVEDDDQYSALMGVMLDEAFGSQAQVRRSGSLEAGTSEVVDFSPDCILVDLYLPDARGVQCVQSLHAAAPLVALVVISGDDDEDLALSAVTAGAQDYLIKGSFDTMMLARTISYAIERKRLQTGLAQMALQDPLTGLANRTLFFDRLSGALSRTKRNQTHLGLFFIDLDRFKAINDQLGHGVGDQVLVRVARRIEQKLRPMDTLARMGGDEFAVISEAITSPSDVQGIDGRLRSALREPLVIDGHDVEVNASVGVALSDGSHDPITLLRLADDEMYRDKRSGSAKREAQPDPSDPTDRGSTHPVS